MFFGKFEQRTRKLQPQLVEECKESYIEIMKPGPLLDDTAETDAFTPLDFRASPSAHILIQTDYCPQTVSI